MQVYMSKEHIYWLYMEGKAPWCGTPRTRGLGRGGNWEFNLTLKKMLPIYEIYPLEAQGKY